MKRRGFFGGLAVLLAAPSVLVRKQKTEKHWVCANCGEELPKPLGVDVHQYPGKPHSFLKGLGSGPTSIEFHAEDGPKARIVGGPRECPFCACGLSYAVWK